MSVKPSLYNEITIVSSTSGKESDLRLGVLSLDIYESVLVPTVTARMMVVDSGGNGDEPTVFQGLPIRKLDTVTISINPNSELNERIDQSLIVRSTSNADISMNKEMFTLDLCSQVGINNQMTKLVKFYSGEALYSDNISSILSESLGLTAEDSPNIEATSNGSGFYGNKQTPFKVISNVARKSSPASGTTKANSGFFFYETREGIQFRSINSLVEQAPKDSFVYSEVNHSEYGFTPTPDVPTLDRKILDFKILKSQDIIEDFARGTLSAERNYFDAFSQIVTTESRYDSSEYSQQMPNLGIENFNDPQGTLYGSALDQATTYVSGYIARGTTAKEVSTDFDRDNFSEDSSANTRYNSIVSQQLEMTVPLSSNVYAGDVVEVNFPQNSTTHARSKETLQISGNYLVFRLVHHFDSKGSYTKMTLVRDTHGVK